MKQSRELFSDIRVGVPTKNPRMNKLDSTMLNPSEVGLVMLASTRE